METCVKRLRARVLNKRDTMEAQRSNELAPPRGILRSPKPDGVLKGRRMLPSDKLGEYVHHFWSVRWALRSPFTGESLPHPSVQIILSNEVARVHGVNTGRFAKRLSNEGRMFGIAFRPVMFQPVYGASMARLTDRVVALDRMFGARAKAWAHAMIETTDGDDEVDITEAFLESVTPPASPEVVRMRDLVERIGSDRSLCRVEDVSAVSGLDTRALQRRFQTYVGVSPKSVIQRYRMHEAAMQLSAPHPPALAELAASLGYADQAHFGRDFKRTIGRTPRSFARVALRTFR